MYTHAHTHAHKHTHTISVSLNSGGDTYCNGAMILYNVVCIKSSKPSHVVHLQTRKLGKSAPRIQAFIFQKLLSYYFMLRRTREKMLGLVNVCEYRVSEKFVFDSWFSLNTFFICYLMSYNNNVTQRFSFSKREQNKGVCMRKSLV